VASGDREIMSEDIRAHIYDEHGKKRHLSTEEMLSVYASLLRAIYVDVMGIILKALGNKF
jgi:hypothetical protein